MSRALVIASVAVGLVAGACALFQKPLEEPEVEYRELRIERAGLSGLDAYLGLDLFNPNDVGLPLEGGSFELAIAGSRAATTEFELSETIPARGTAPIDVRVRLGTADAARVASAVASGARNYELTGELEFATSLGRLTAVYTHRGEVTDLARRLR